MDSLQKSIDSLQKSAEQKAKSSTSRLKKLKTILDKVKRYKKAWSGSFTVGIPNIAEFSGEFDPSKVEEDETDKIETLQAIKPTLQQGIEIIQELIQELSREPDSSGKERKISLQLVVLIDDLDRCTPEKALEVFESTKIFFSFDGIVFLLGLSKEIVEAAITEKYKSFGPLFSGAEYLKKIIQLPFFIPPMTGNEIDSFVSFLIGRVHDSYYKEIFESHHPLINECVIPNPREIKRFLNNFVLAHRIFGSNDKIEADKLLAIQSIQMRWLWFFEGIRRDKYALQKLRSLLNIPIENLSIDTMKDDLTKRALRDPSLREFLRGKGGIVFDISEITWDFYFASGVAISGRWQLVKDRIIAATKEFVAHYQIPEVGQNITPKATSWDDIINRIKSDES